MRESADVLPLILTILVILALKPEPKHRPPTASPQEIYRRYRDSQRPPSIKWGDVRDDT